MNRRTLLKMAAGAFAGTALPAFECERRRRVWALDSSMASGYHTKWIQWHIDKGIAIPQGRWYTVDAPLVIKPESKGMILVNSTIQSAAPGSNLVLITERPLDPDKDRIYGSAIIGQAPLAIDKIHVL